MLCLPEFDTYHILPEYAKNPEGAYNNLALRVLKRRVKTSLNWRLLNCRVATKENAADLFDLQMGYSKNTKASKDITRMSKDELMNMFMGAVEAVGLEVDPTTFTAHNKS